MAYGDKRDYRKIDIFVGGKYRCSTTWARNCKEAKEKFLEGAGKGLNLGTVTVRFA